MQLPAIRLMPIAATSSTHPFHSTSINAHTRISPHRPNILRKLAMQRRYMAGEDSRGTLIFRSVAW